MTLLSPFDGETTRVIELFHKVWSTIPNLVLYGIGRHTRTILEHFPHADIVGLMAQDRQEGSLWGKPFLSCEDVARRKSTVIVVARNAVIPIIWRRIAFLEQDGVSICDLAGNRLTARRYTYADCTYYTYATKENLLKTIDRYTYISFDFFDTLFTRNILYPKDIFSKIQSRLIPSASEREQDFIRHFPEYRACYAQHEFLIYTLKDIYQRLGEQYKLNDNFIEYCYVTEKAIEKSVLIGRRDMLNIFTYCLQSKKTYILSDTHFTRSFLQSLLRREQIVIPDTHLLLSCEQGASKEDGTLYRHYLNSFSFPPEQCLHIGDNHIVDGQNAIACGIAAFPVFSGSELLLHSSMQELLTQSEQADGRPHGSVLGRFAAEALNSPFALSASKGQFSLDSVSTLGRYFIAPLVLHYMLWLHETLQQHKNIELMLFTARDGWLFFQVYRKLRARGFHFPPARYILTSRKACSLAAITEQADIFKCSREPFNGTIQEFFACKFGMDVSDDRPFSHQLFCDTCGTYIPQILEKAARARQDYLRYLSRCLTREGEYALFDFVAAGSVQRYLEKILQKPLYGCYFAQFPTDHHDIQISSPFIIDNFCTTNKLSQIYLFLECLFTSPRTTFTGFTGNHPLFEAPGRNMYWKDISLIHQAVMAAVLEWADIRDKHALEEALCLAATLFDDSCIVPETIKKIFVNDDSFVNKPRSNLWI